jgi:hypothetical protein
MRALSNHGLRESLTKLARVLARTPVRRAEPAVIVCRRSGPGTVVNAVVAVLAAAEHPMSPQEVYAAVEALLDVRRGRYRLARSGDRNG